MATIGQELLAPEAGWKRYDDTHPAIKYKGAWNRATLTGTYQSSYSHAPNIGDSFEFIFTGTKIRLITRVSATGISADNEVFINGGRVGSYSGIYGSAQNQVLVYELEGLESDVNRIEVINRGGGTNGSSLVIDAIDIDGTGRLLHPSEVTDVKDLDVGKRIRCHYQASSGAVGSFSGLGQETSDFIPVASTATPNGDFYLIMVEDWNGNKILVADRNIQHTISWDTLNSAGIASGSGLIFPNAMDELNKLPNPSDLPASHGNGVAFSPDNTYVAVAHTTSPFLAIYKRSGDTFTKLANPSTLPASNALTAGFSPDGNYLAVGHSISPFITIYKRSGDTFTKLANPSTLPTGAAVGDLSFTSDGSHLCVSHTNAPFITIYKRNGDTFTKLSDPADLPSSQANGAEFSKDGNYLLISNSISPFMTIYKRSGDTFTKLPNPSELPPNTGRGGTFSPDGVHMAVLHSDAPFITIYKRAGDTFTKLPSLNELPTNVGNGLMFSPDGKYLTIAHSDTPYLTTYKREGDVFTKLTNPDTLPASTGNDVAFSPDNTYVAVAHVGTPFLTIYKNNRYTLLDSEDVSVSVRLLTGGISGPDRDNEWDKYIGNSNLNGTSTPGDNAVWNWGGAYSWTSSTPGIGPSANRVDRGNSAVDTNVSAATTSLQGFRPVFGIEQLTSYVTKFLVDDGGIIKTFRSGEWVELGDAPATVEMFLNDGMDSLLGESFVSLGSANAIPLIYTDDPAASYSSLEIQGEPLDQIVLPTGDIDVSSAEGIESVNLVASENVRLIVSADAGLTWRAYNGTGWVNVEPTVESVADGGMAPTALNALTRTEWDAFFGTEVPGYIRFGYLLTSEVANADSLTLTVAMMGTWAAAKHGVDYDYEYTGRTTLKVDFLTSGDYKINY